LRDDAPLDDVARVVREQARAALDLAGYVESHYDFQDEVPEIDHDDAHRRFGECFDRLLAWVRPEDGIEGDGSPLELRRTYAVTRNGLFPPEWRVAAMRSFLGEELREAIETWRGYVAAVRRGEHRGYLRELLAYDLSLDVVGHWRELRRVRSRRGRGRTRGRARRR
jgi:hypothetical protein